MDAEILKRAEKAVEQLRKTYPEWVLSDVDRMASILEEAKTLSGEAQERRLEEIFSFAHNIKGQGTSFGYPLMTEIGESLCHFLRTPKKIDDEGFRLIEHHILAMRTVIRNRICNASDPLAVKTVSELRAAGAGRA
ncbi:MAG: Hpt domain-containing protein [Alphaproteobacteria bacterium]|nr:Hpt domain-containing protein [Alphaproteobacteria bacterium]